MVLFTIGGASRDASDASKKSVYIAHYKSMPVKSWFAREKRSTEAFAKSNLSQNRARGGSSNCAGSAAVRWGARLEWGPTRPRCSARGAPCPAPQWLGRRHTPAAPPRRRVSGEGRRPRVGRGAVMRDPRRDPLHGRRSGAAGPGDPTPAAAARHCCRGPVAWGTAGRGARTKVYLILLVLWKNGSGFGACTSIDPKLRRRIRGWPSGPQKKKRSAKRSTSHPLMPTSAFVSIRGIRSARFSTAPDL